MGLDHGALGAPGEPPAVVGVLWPCERPPACRLCVLRHRRRPSRTRGRISRSRVPGGMDSKERWQSMATTAPALRARSARRGSDARGAARGGREPAAQSWQAAAHLGSSPTGIAVCPTRAATTAIPRGRVSPWGGGLSPRRTGWQRYVLARSGAARRPLLAAAWPWATLSSIVTPSPPGAP
jgi:hypothetical protein